MQFTQSKNRVCLISSGTITALNTATTPQSKNTRIVIKIQMSMLIKARVPIIQMKKAIKKTIRPMSQ